MFKLKYLIILIITSIVVAWFVTYKPPEPKQWQANKWAKALAQNHNKISVCYSLIADTKQLDIFSQTCNITTILIIENTIIRSYALQHKKHPGTTQLEFLLHYYDNKNAIILSSHFDNQQDFNMTIMIMMFAEAIINSNNTRTNHESDIQTIPTRKHN